MRTARRRTPETRKPLLGPEPFEATPLRPDRRRAVETQRKSGRALIPEPNERAESITGLELRRRNAAEMKSAWSCRPCVWIRRDGLCRRQDALLLLQFGPRLCFENNGVGAGVAVRRSRASGVAHNLYSEAQRPAHYLDQTFVNRVESDRLHRRQYRK